MISTWADFVLGAYFFELFFKSRKLGTQHENTDSLIEWQDPLIDYIDSLIERPNSLID